MDEALVLRTWSDLDRIATKDFAELTAEELAMVRSGLERLTWNLEARRTRRWVPGPRQPHRSAARAGAQPSHRRRDHRAAAAAAARPGRRPIVLLCDVSGSMERYTRTLLLFAHTLSRGTRDVEAFLFATRLTRITMELRAPKPDAAMAAVSRAVKDWSGGTRIGEALRTFHQRWRRRTLHGSSGRDPDFRRLGSRRSAAPARGDRAAAAQLPPAVWLNPLIGTRRLRAADARAAGGAAVRRRFPARADAAGRRAISRYTWARSRDHGHHRHLHLRRPAGHVWALMLDPGRDRIMHPGL